MAGSWEEGQVEKGRELCHRRGPLPPGEAKAFDLHIGPKPQGSRCTVRVGLDACDGLAETELAVTVNGAACRALGDLPQLMIRGAL